MQYNPTYFSAAAPPNYTPYNRPFSATYQHQCSPYPEVIGEGDVTSLVQPDGSVQLYFLPVNTKLNVPYVAPSTGCSRCNANRVWFVRSVTTVLNPTPPLFNVQPPSPIPYGALCPTPFGSNFEAPRPPPSYFSPGCKFHNDKNTSSTDLKYFSPLQQEVSKANKHVQIETSTENRSAETEEPCCVNKSAETQETFDSCDESMSIDEKKSRRHNQEKRERSKSEDSQSRDKNKKQKIETKSSQTCCESYPSTSCSSMSIDDSTENSKSKQQKPNEARSSQVISKYLEPEKKSKQTTAEEKKSSSRERKTSNESGMVCKSSTAQDESLKSEKKSKQKIWHMFNITKSNKRRSRERKPTQENHTGVCESCTTVDTRPEKKSLQETASKTKSTSTEREPSLENCGISESCTADDDKYSKANTASMTETNNVFMSRLPCRDCNTAAFSIQLDFCKIGTNPTGSSCIQLD